MNNANLNALAVGPRTYHRAKSNYTTPWSVEIIDPIIWRAHAIFYSYMLHSVAIKPRQ